MMRENGRLQDIVIRPDRETYMSDLKKWLKDMEDVPLEDMDAFFTRRISGYEEHMSVWKKAYERFAGLLPDWCVEIVDLGCGTGLELDEIWERNPGISVTGVDLSQSMLKELVKKHPDKQLETVCADYFQYELGESCHDAVISFESLHHFPPEKKKRLYRKVYRGLKPGGIFLLGDYVACCEEEEELLREICQLKRQREGIPEESFVHFDTPLTLVHEIEILADAGFGKAEVVECVDGATIIYCIKV